MRGILYRFSSICFPISIFALLIFLSYPNALAAKASQKSCFDRARLAAYLELVFQEKRSAAGLTSAGSVLEFYLDPLSRSWTLTITQDGKESCIILTGTSFINHTAKLEGPGI